MKRIAAMAFALFALTAMADWRGAFDDAYFAQPAAADPYHGMPVSLATNCVLWQDFSADTGTNFISVLGCRNGYALGSPAWVTNAGGSVNLSGSSEIRFSTNAFVEADGPVTVSLWYYRTANVEWGMLATLVQDTQFLITHGGNGTQYPIVIGHRAHKQMTTTNPALYVANQVNRWIHLVAIYDGVNRDALSSLWCYYNGILQTSADAGDGGGSGNFNSIGSSGGSEYFTGIVDDVMVFNRVLTSDECYQLYMMGSTNGTGTH